MIINKIINTDCLNMMQDLPNNSVNLAILDPPYNINADKWDKIKDYYKWMQKILKETIRILKPNGSLYLWGTSKNNDFLRLKLWIDENINKLKFKNWIVWIHECKIHRQLKDRYLTKHEDLLFYAGNNSTFNIQRDEPPDFQLKMLKGRYDKNYFVPQENLYPSQQKIFKNGLQMGSPAKSWWKGLSNQSASKKYKNFMGYKSEWVCERIIKASSNKKDLILIPFAGYGTECVTSYRLNRFFLASEINELHYKTAIKRIENIKKISNYQQNQISQEYKKNTESLIPI